VLQLRPTSCALRASMGHSIKHVLHNEWETAEVCLEAFPGRYASQPNGQNSLLVPARFWSQQQVALWVVTRDFGAQWMSHESALGMLMLLCCVQRLPPCWVDAAAKP
jgi:hypothetical protein